MQNTDDSSSEPGQVRAKNRFLVERLSPARAALLDQLLAAVDPRVGLTASGVLECAPRTAAIRPRVVLVGHRAAGKSRLLPFVAEWCGWRAADLDREIGVRTGKSPREWVEQDLTRFRGLEREVFTAIEGPVVLSVGGGFLSLHPDLLVDTTPVLVPVTFETYRDRLLADRDRPRLRPELTPEEEIARVFEEREHLHARHPTWSLEEFLASTLRGVAR